MTQTTRQGASRRAWSYKAGEKGRNRVRVFLWADSIWIDYREDGRRVRKDLHHADIERAKQLADEVAATIGTVSVVPASSVGLTFGRLFDMYEREVTPRKAAATQAHDRRAMQLARRCWGATAIASADRRDWDRFIERRRSGALTGTKVRDGVIAQNLRLVMAVLHWGETVRVNGRKLVDRNPFAGFPFPKEASPRRPALTEVEFRALVAAAPRVSSRCPLFLLLVHDTGHRYNAVAQLRWSDVDLAGANITWRAENDKLGHGHTTPLSEECVAALRAVRQRDRVIGDAWIFPAPRDATKAIDRFRARDWWRRLEKFSRIARVPGRGWHSLRRKFATEHMDLPLRELMAIGGWQSQRTIVECYQQPREAHLRAALQRRRTLREANGQ